LRSGTEEPWLEEAAAGQFASWRASQFDLKIDKDRTISNSKWDVPGEYRQFQIYGSSSQIRQQPARELIPETMYSINAEFGSL